MAFSRCRRRPVTHYPRVVQIEANSVSHYAYPCVANSLQEVSASPRSRLCPHCAARVGGIPRAVEYRTGAELPSLRRPPPVPSISAAFPPVPVRFRLPCRSPPSFCVSMVGCRPLRVARRGWHWRRHTGDAFSSALRRVDRFPGKRTRSFGQRLVGSICKGLSLT